ncbi:MULTISPECIES: LytTR family DNA-binding domain-containing protein [unclassified Sphingobacterium]|uniref:LytTR family DNA-binding domain-containing protein n=1 Tax=unclassified Sphingobacterium TaxID=2609468 RepID=UPI0014388362|nr:LytTR family DNA-binding domain-containing protein [Sphingobacterium sp. B16(2022)]NJI73460.1 LytTR family transcriptional regulator [Sphingobacterium sp. B16(2022)]
MILDAAYPDSESHQEIILTSTLVGILFYVLLIIYQPFGTSQFEHTYKYLLLFPYAVMTSFSFCTVNLLSLQWKKKWTIGLELFKAFLILFLISIFAYLYNSLYLSEVQLSVENFLYMFAYTTALGIPVSSIYILARFIYLNNKDRSNEVRENYQHIEKTDNCIEEEDNLKLCIVSDYANFHQEMDVDDFILAEAADNYCILHFYEKGILKKEMVRISLTKLLDQVECDTIQKVHRSFIFNLRKVTKFKGNTAGYKISLENIDREVTVSRNYITPVIPLLKEFAVRP